MLALFTQWQPEIVPILLYNLSSRQSSCTLSDIS